MSFIHKNKAALIFNPYWVIRYGVHIFKIFHRDGIGSGSLLKRPKCVTKRHNSYLRRGGSSAVTN